MNGRALHEIGVDPLADATLFALQQRGEGALDGELGGTERGVRRLDENRSRGVQRVANAAMKPVLAMITASYPFTPAYGPVRGKPPIDV